ncbi:MAG: FAD-dependent thymidylate synthase [Desulfobulbaceae bacterium]|nr:FAD-dependent thymidylate synthase [Desulfobulbaceae bacterium]
MLIVEPSYQIQDELDQASLVVRLEACGRICYKSEELISSNSALPFVKKIAAHGHNSVLEMAVVTLLLNGDLEPESLYALQPKYLVIDPYQDGLLVTGSVRAFRECAGHASRSRLVAAMVGFLAGRHPYLFEGVADSAKTSADTGGISVGKMALPAVEQLPGPLLLRHRYVGVKFIVNRAVTHELVRHRPCSFLQESQRYCRYSQDKFGNQVSFIKPMFFNQDSAEYKLWLRAMEQTEQIYLQLLATSTPQAARTVLPNSCKTEIITYCNLAQWRHIFSLRTIPAAEPSMREIMIPLAAELQRRYPVLQHV